MKFVYTLLILCGVSLTGFSQVVISPAGDGGFETGTTFAANGWTPINPASAANQWTVDNTAGVFAGARCVYVTNTGGGAYNYTIGAAKVCHFYRDVTIPAGSTGITLSFQWKGSGEA